MELEAVETGQRREVGVEEVWCGSGCGSAEEVWCARSLEQLEHLRRRGEQKERPEGEVGARLLERAQRIVETVERIEEQLAAWRAQGGGQETRASARVV
jgi:hypothetical protein